MILFNLDKLLKISKQVQVKYLTGKEGTALANNPTATNKRNVQKDMDNMVTHKMQIIHIDEDQLELLVKLLTSNEQNGEIVNKIYEIL